ncbi:hypothetical protein EVAR_33658_1 [Eumeta japonica]|uniref:Uncharacterized protein n=1 Tax=Eumeta variegata TaxID=151549 RepID=A0A4C1VQH3_EUMVA|nr:hypothetical protein EVAR_33658_1 [Eumeta japonica]
MSLDIMFLTNDNIRRTRKDPEVLGLRYRGFTNGIENDQNSANPDHGDTPRKRLSTSSTTSNQSYDSQGPEYDTPRPSYQSSQRASDGSEILPENLPKLTNPLYGVNAASHYSPAPIQQLQDAPEHKPSIPNGVRKAPEGQDNEAFKPDDTVDGRKDVIVGPRLADGSATYTTDNNGKINVHVTVMINAGTLADLKKQRAQIRTNGSPIETTAASTGHSNSHSLASIPDATKDTPAQLNPLSLSPSSGTIPRFSGHTSEVVGDTRSNRCCVIV